MKITMLTTIHNAFDHRVFGKEARSLCEDHDVSIIAVSELVRGVTEYSTHDGIKIIEYPGELTPRGHIFNCFTAFIQGLTHPADVYHCHEPSSLFLGCLLKVVHGSKLVYDRHDYYPVLIREKIEKLGLGVLGAAVEFIESTAEKVMMKFTDKIITVDEVMSRSVSSTNTVIHNYPTGITGKLRAGCTFGYAGILDHRKIMESIRIINELSSTVKSAKYKIVGRAFDSTLIPKNTDSINYCGVIPHEQITEFMSDVSFGICLYDKLPRYETAVSTKTYEYIALGIPVVASRTAGNQFIEDNGFGVLVDPDNLVEAVDIIRAVIPRCEEFSRNCLNAKFIWETEKLLNLYKELEQ